MRNKFGVNKTERKRIVEDIFGDAGLINADDSQAFEQAADTLQGRHSESIVDASRPLQSLCAASNPRLTFSSRGKVIRGLHVGGTTTPANPPIIC